MDIIFENIPSIIIVTVLFLSVYAALLNIYFIRKNGFRVRVNCWFCNKNAKVLYSNRNSFICPFCCQYNGFSKDGGYNRIIEAQHVASLNNLDIFHNQKTGQSIPKKSNGLCESCNRNQQLKVKQLANYEPLVEKNYDKEIKHFELQLEKTYQLCRTCRKLVNNTVRKQNANIFGNRMKKLKATKDALWRKANKVSWGTQISSFHQKLSVTQLILFFLSVVNVCFLCDLDKMLPQEVLPKHVLPNAVKILNMYPLFTNLTVPNLTIYLPRFMTFHDSVIPYVSILGCSIEFISSFFEEEVKLFTKSNKVIAWIIIGVVSRFTVQKDILYVKTLELFCALFLTYTYCSSCVKTDTKKLHTYSLKRIKRDLQYTSYSDDEESDSDMLNNSHTSYKTAVNSPATNTWKMSPNNSFESIRSKSTMFNNTFVTDDTLTTKNTELNKYFNDLSIGAFDPNASRECHRCLSPNPFLNRGGPQSPLGSSFNNSAGMFSPGRRNASTMNNINGNTARQAHNMYPQLSSSLSKEPFIRNGHIQSNIPRSTSSVLPHNNTVQFPVYNSRSSVRSPVSVNQVSDNIFRPLSPLERPSRTLLSPVQPSNVNSFHSEGNGSLSMSFHTQPPTSTSFWQNFSSAHLPQRFVVNSLSNIQLDNSGVSDNGNHDKWIHSRSSSTSSGFVSNGELMKGLSHSLPNSRDNSPERSSLLSEPVYTDY